MANSIANIRLFISFLLPPFFVARISVKSGHRSESGTFRCAWTLLHQFFTSPIIAHETCFVNRKITKNYKIIYTFLPQVSTIIVPDDSFIAV